MKLQVSALALAITMSAAPAMATVFAYEAVLSAANEVPTNPSTATGYAKVMWDDAALTMSVEANFTGLTTGVTAAHIHFLAQPTDLTGMVATTTPTFPDFPSLVTSGSYSRTFNMLDAASYRPGFITNPGGGTPAGAAAALFTYLQLEQTYFNIHTTQNPGGEIRGTLRAVNPVPEPSTWALLIAGFGLTGAALRQRRRVAAEA